MFAQSQYTGLLPSDSELLRSTENIAKGSASLDRLCSIIQMCDRRIGLGEKDLDKTCNTFMKLFDYHLRQFLVNNNHSLNLALYPFAISIPPPVDFQTSRYTSSAVALDYILLLRELEKIANSCSEADMAIVKLCISLYDDQLAKFQHIEKDASEQIIKIMNISGTQQN